ncbi:hypothetical protein E2P81_ATG04636 [Venturia nashicola]|nr:hypothetical protein E2P81_ATG04636 [Venturia nashicola]
MASYAQYPPGAQPFSDHYRTPPPVSPPHGAGYYSPSNPRYSVHMATPSPRGSPKVAAHARRASHAPAGFSYANSPRVPAHFFADSHTSSSPRYPSYQSTPLRANYDNVSGFDYDSRGETRSYRAPDGIYTKFAQAQDRRKSHDPRRRSSHWHYVFVDDGYGNYDAPPPYTTTYEYFDAGARTDQRYYRHQTPSYEQTQESTPLKANQSRQRRASTAARPQPLPPKKAAKTAEKPHRKATDEDARRAGIPAGYSFKNWDPTEEPITLLGSVFDANSLGKWIYDWTVFYHGPATPMSDMAGDLWLLLIQLAGKVKRADECISKIRQEESRELVEDFLDSGERLWVRFKKLLKICEEYMWKAAKKENGEKKPATMGKNSGCEFVDSLFGRDRELDKTEKLMSAIRLWSMRFDANCDEILRNPAA